MNADNHNEIIYHIRNYMSNIFYKLLDVWIHVIVIVQIKSVSNIGIFEFGESDKWRSYLLWEKLEFVLAVNTSAYERALQCDISCGHYHITLFALCFV